MISVDSTSFSTNSKILQIKKNLMNEMVAKNPKNFIEYKKIMKSFDFCIYSNSIQYRLFLMVYKWSFNYSRSVKRWLTA